MKRGSLLQFLGIWVSSLTSIFAAHTLMAKSDIKELTKTSKKLRPSQSQATAGREHSAMDAGRAGPAGESRRSLPVEK